MTDTNISAADIVEALNSICAELKNLNRTLAQSSQSSQESSRPSFRAPAGAGSDGPSYGRPRAGGSSDGPSYGRPRAGGSSDGPSYGRPRATGAAGRVGNKKAREERLGGATKAKAKSRDFAGSSAPRKPK